MSLRNETTISTIFEFERQFKETEFREWILANWTNCYAFSAAYVVLIFSVKWYMQHRKPYDLRPYLFTWSAVLAIFSILGAARTIPELTYMIANYGLKSSVCTPGFYTDTVTKFWAFMFTISKVYELGDTLFVVLRKQQLIFLHWYHHISVLIYVWYSYPDYTAPGRWFMCMNYTVHSFMYTYYAARALKWWRVPVIINKIITMMQITQMIIGISINIWVYNIKSANEQCDQSWDNLWYSTMMYVSYFILFALFFYNSYMHPKGKFVKTQ